MQFFNWYITPLYFATLAALLITGNPKGKALEKPIFVALSILWVLAALTRPWGLSVDDVGYEAHFVLTGPFSEDGFENVLGFSYFYYLLLAIVRDFDNSYSAFLIISASFLALKFILLGKVTHYSLLSLLIYVSIFFRLHDVIQFRVGVATFFYLLSIYLVVQREYLKTIASYVSSVLFHSQAAVAPLTAACLKIFKDRYGLAILIILATQTLSLINLSPPLENLLAVMNLEDNSRLGSTVDSNESFSGGFRATSVAIILFLFLSIKPLKIYGDEYPIFKYVFFSVVAGFLLYWVTSSVYTVSNRLMQFMWVPLVFMGPLMNKSRAFYFGGIGICISFFILNGWINTWESVN